MPYSGATNSLVAWKSSKLSQQLGTVSGCAGHHQDRYLHAQDGLELALHYDTHRLSLICPSSHLYSKFRIDAMPFFLLFYYSAKMLSHLLVSHCGQFNVFIPVPNDREKEQ
jgi:hypothetical protein